MVKKFRWIFGIGVVAAAGWFGVTGALFAAEPINHLSSEICKTCHTEIFKQWKGSMHANSTAFNDPIHATFYRSEVGDPGQEGAVHKNQTVIQFAWGVMHPMRHVIKKPNSMLWRHTTKGLTVSPAIL